MATIGDKMRDKKIFKIPASFKASKPTDQPTAPMIPPISACYEELGIPQYQVNKFHVMAPIRAAAMILLLIRDADITMSPPIVFATPVLTIAPKKLSAAVIIIAFLGSIARVDTDVAMAFAVSWKPLI